MHRRNLLRAQSDIASTKQIFLPSHPTTTDLIFTLLAIESILLTLFRLFIFQVAYPPLSLQLSLPFHDLSFLVLVSVYWLPDQKLLTSSSAPQPVSPHGLIIALSRVSLHAQHLINL